MEQPAKQPSPFIRFKQTFKQHNFALFTALFYLSLVIFLVGMARKIYQYWITPTPLKIPTAPTPLTQTGVVMIKNKDT
jgi:hypothetical protein